jgi:hypothetical protein
MRITLDRKKKQDDDDEIVKKNQFKKLSQIKKITIKRMKTKFKRLKK